MPADRRLKVVLCWHMHQPQYRDLIRGEYLLPWTYLHVIKDYADMAAHLEAHPGARAVVNFAPVLLEQVADYAAQVRDFLTHGTTIRDPMLAGLVEPHSPPDADSRLALVKGCLRANEARLIERFAPYRRLAYIGRWLLANPAAAVYLQAQFLTDLLVWHHLAWCGETVRRADARVRRLMEKGADYTPDDRRELLAVIGELLDRVIGRYRALAEAGRVELSITPYGHPILPLLLDFKNARDAMPDAVLPALERYPQGEERARWHLRRGRAAYARHFGREPRGCWPAEGSICARTLELAAESGFGWAASGESVLRHTLNRAGQHPDGHSDRRHKDPWLYRRYAGPAGLSVFFRDDTLSDLIGFTYSTWHADDAVSNFVHHLEQIAQRSRAHPERVVSVILDGENAWEHYPENGYHFLNALYARLADHAHIALTTFSDCDALEPAPLPAVVAGSWVYGTFSTWIGSPDKNRGWEMLGDAARAFHAERPPREVDPGALAQADEQLAVCEGSDWFWWFGDYNPAETVSDFERLYRRHLTNLYELLGVEPPSYLSAAFTRGAGAPPQGGTMRPGEPTA